MKMSTPHFHASVERKPHDNHLFFPDMLIFELTP